MGNMISAKVSIVGIRPLFWHVFGPESLPLEKQERTGVAGNNPEEWKKTVLYTKEGQLYLRPDYIFACIRDAAKYTKRGRATLQKSVAATLQVIDRKVLIDRYIPGFQDSKLPDEMPTDDELPVYLDIRGVVNPNTRGRNVRYRVACSPDWKTSFTLIWDKTIVSREELNAVLLDAGKLVGLGNGRGLGMGRFKIANFEILESDAQD